MSKIFSMLKQADKDKQKYSRAVEQASSVPVDSVEPAPELKKASKFTVLVMIVLAVGVSLGMIYMFQTVQQVSSDVQKLSDKVAKMQQSVDSGTSQAKSLSSSVQQVDTRIKEAQESAKAASAKVTQLQTDFARYKAQEEELKSAAQQTGLATDSAQIQSDVEELKRKVYFLLMSNAKSGH
jgi:cell division protein FtsL